MMDRQTGRTDRQDGQTDRMDRQTVPLGSDPLAVDELGGGGDRLDVPPAPAANGGEGCGPQPPQMAKC